MTIVDPELRETVIRLEGKVDNIGQRVGGEMTALTRHIETLVEMLNLQIRTTQEDVGEVKRDLQSERRVASAEVSAARVDLERQLSDTRVQVADRLSEGVKRHDDARDERMRMFHRLDALDKAVNRLYGGIGLAGALGLSGLVALLKGLGVG